MRSNHPEYQKVVDAFKVFKMTPDGQIVMDYLQGVFLYPNPHLAGDLGTTKEPTNDELLGHHRVILHMMAMMGQD